MDVRIPLLAAVIGYWLLGLPIGTGLALKTALGPLGLWWGLAIGLIVVAVMLAARFHYRIGKLTANTPSANLGWLAKP
jgi:MATE family multidrug resistance protein